MLLKSTVATFLMSQSISGSLKRPEAMPVSGSGLVADWTQDKHLLVSKVMAEPPMDCSTEIFEPSAVNLLPLGTVAWMTSAKRSMASAMVTMPLRISTLTSVSSGDGEYVNVSSVVNSKTYFLSPSTSMEMVEWFDGIFVNSIWARAE
ncbi:unknown [Acetobacter sp. CAG:977]|nr:unknown [Acetobacter sp. CAG:977]